MSTSAVPTSLWLESMAAPSLPGAQSSLPGCKETPIRHRVYLLALTFPCVLAQNAVAVPVRFAVHLQRKVLHRLLPSRLWQRKLLGQTRSRLSLPLLPWPLYQRTLLAQTVFHLLASLLLNPLWQLPLLDQTLCHLPVCRLLRLLQRHTPLGQASSVSVSQLVLVHLRLRLLLQLGLV